MQIIDNIKDIEFDKGESGFDLRGKVIQTVNRNLPLDDPQNANFTFDTGTNFRGMFNKVCHYYVCETLRGTKTFINFFSEERPVGREEMLSFLLSEESPYKDALKKATLLRNKGVIKAIVFRDFANEDIKLLTNLLICTRLNTQWNYGQLYLWLMQAGIKPETGIILCQSVYNSNYVDPKANLRTDLNLRQDTTSDGPFNSFNKRCDEKFFQPSRFYKGDYTKTGTRATQMPNPCNFIWSGLSLPIIRRIGSDKLSEWGTVSYGSPCVKVGSEFDSIYRPFIKGDDKPDEGLLKSVEDKLMKDERINAS